MCAHYFATHNDKPKLKEGKIGVSYSSEFGRFSNQAVIAYFLVAGLYLCWLFFGLEQFRSDHILLVVGCTLIYFANSTSRKLFLAFGFLIIYWMIFDSIRLWPNYVINPPLHISEPYLFDKAWFGISTAEGVLTPNEYFGQHNNTFLDIYSAFTYISWIPIPVAFALWLFFTKRRTLVVKFLFLFLLVS